MKNMFGSHFFFENTKNTKNIKFRKQRVNSVNTVLDFGNGSLLSTQNTQLILHG